MSQSHMRYAFYHRSSRTFVETTRRGIVVLRFVGRRVEKVGVIDAGECQVGMSSNGIVSIFEREYARLTDITGKSLRRRSVRVGEAVRAVISPDGKRVVAWPYNSDGEADDELVAITAAGRRGRRAIWRGRTDDLRSLRYAKDARPGKPTDGRIQFPEIALDGAYWAAVEDDGIAIGRGARRTAIVQLKGKAFFPIRFGWDRTLRRLWISGKTGLAALATDGRVAAVSKLEVCSAPAYVGDELLVVRRLAGGGYLEPTDYQVVRLDPRTLKLLGPVEGVPVRREAHDAESAIVALGGEAFAWSLGDAPPMIVGVELEPSEHIALPQQALDRLSAPPDATEDQLAAKTILDELVANPRFDRLLEAGAFAPWADAVCGWSDARIARLQTIGTRDWWQVTEGASDAAVDALAASVRAGGPQRDARFQLLCGAGTDRALERIGALATKDLRNIAERCNLGIEGKRGVRRFAPGGFAVVAGRKATKGLDYLRDPRTLLVDPRGTTCDAAQFHVLGVDLALLPGNPLAKSALKTQHLFKSGCQECDEPNDDVFERVGDKLARNGARSRHPCAGATTKPGRKRKLALVPLSENPSQTCGRVGGRPDWVQSPVVLRCCRIPMFFVAQANMYWVMGNLPAGTVFSFHCERCSTTSQLVQFT